MPRVKKTRQEIACQFFVSVSEIQRLFGIGRAMASRCFQDSQRRDKAELGDSYYEETLVRLSTVLKVLGIREEELRKKINASEAAGNEN